MDQGKTRVLFVCMGNICRSPAAECVMRTLVAKAGRSAQVEIGSAGTIGMHAGELPDARMRAAALKRGYALTSRARKFTAEDFAAYDLILTMDEENRRNVLALAKTEEDRARVRAFCEFCERHDDEEVPDPYYGGPQGFEHVLDLLEDGCRGILESLRERK
ncbi:protein tyrosine phosphatase [Nibricoccus aquaticus]|uniref:Protein tyrosine phosphatase n=1 Tax=Nibricoccus aquaticus TaxID=2576891 RepID=A0A290QBY2_9BACT|nr:low molecular weight protein-tyrosine-phosphatase [Nibricoccus aquaticus]ATC66179.1 protein tyrosine phosphatase [Nibricoccus aquaticus]